MSSGRRWTVAAPATICALVTAALPGLTSEATAVSAASRAVGVARVTSVAAPALLGANRIRAQVPGGGIVGYALPVLPSGGVRVLGDWNGDGVETAGIFHDGQWQLWNQVVRARAPYRTTTFGQAGDRPVTGDWNGDGITDLGVVRGSQWLLALGPVPDDGSSPPVWRQVTFGDGTGVPVVGDWGDHGVDGIGTFRNGTWTLANSVAAPTRTRTVHYGTAGDAPVAGDWDGDGATGLGVVRGDRWFLSNRVSAPASAVRTTFASSPGDVAMAWQVPTALGATTCPTARAGRTGRAAWVVPSPVRQRDVRRTIDRTGRLVRGSLQQAERYLLGAQFDALWRPTAARPYLDLLHRAGNDELAIRLPAMSAFTVAVGLRTGAFDPAVVAAGVPKATRYVDRLVRSIACAHVSVTPGGWGLGWETSHWAMLTGAAAWLVWDELTPQTRRDVASMMVSEANRQTRLAVAYWALPDGTVLFPGDTKAEEDAWNSSLLALAATMMPKAPGAVGWRAKSAQLAAAAYASRDDDTSTLTVNGVALGRRLGGFNTLPDGTVINHQRVHPDYSAAVQLLWQTADFDRLARLRVPEAMFHNAGRVYSAFSTVSYQTGAASPAGGTFRAPGGTVYRRGRSDIYYPQGDDWGTARRAHFVSLDAHALVYARYLHASAASWPAAEALRWHEGGQRALWRTSGATDGRTYSVDPAVAATQDTYPGREEYAAQNLATAWLALYVGQLGLPRLDTGTLDVPPSVARPATAPPASARVAP